MHTSKSEKKKNSSNALVYASSSPHATRKLGMVLAEEITKERGPFVIALKGDLGSGKTTFLKGFARGLSLRHTLTSPTFLIARGYDTPKKTRPFRRFYHIDAYRITRASELAHIGWDTMIKNPSHIVAVEWAERIPKKMLPSSLEITFSHAHPKKRIITITIPQ